MPSISPFESFGDQVVIVLADYRNSNASLDDEKLRKEVARRITENAKLERLIPNKFLPPLRGAIEATLEVYRHKKVFTDLGLTLEVKNEIVAQAKMVVENHVPGGKPVRQPQQFKLFVGLREEADRLEARLNEWARGDVRDVAGVNDIPHIKRTQLAMASDPRDGEGTVVVGVLVSYEGTT